MPAATIVVGAFGEGAQERYTSQTLDDLFQGTAPIFAFRGVTTSGSPAAWNVRLTIVPLSGTTMTVDSTITFTVTGSGPWVVTINCPLLHASTLLLGAGEAQFQLDRTDSGAQDILAAGTIQIREPEVAIP